MIIIVVFKKLNMFYQQNFGVGRWYPRDSVKMFRVVTATFCYFLGTLCVWLGLWSEYITFWWLVVYFICKLRHTSISWRDSLLHIFLLAIFLLCLFRCNSYRLIIILFNYYTNMWYIIIIMSKSIKKIGVLNWTLWKKRREEMERKAKEVGSSSRLKK